jgi:hypothetical protein
MDANEPLSSIERSEEALSWAGVARCSWSATRTDTGPLMRIGWFAALAACT